MPFISLRTSELILLFTLWARKAFPRYRCGEISERSGKLQKMDIYPFTIHDSFIVSENELPIVKSIVMDSCIELFGVGPQLHEEGLFEIEDKKEDFEEYYFGDLSVMD